MVATKQSKSTRSRWFPLVWVLPAAILLLVAVVLLAQWMRDLPSIQQFLADYPGEAPLPENAPVGIPVWLAVQHFLNSLFLLLIIRSGWEIHRGVRPAAHWTRNNQGLIRTKNPPTKISLTQWFHLSVNSLWVLTGISYLVLIFATGQWVRIVPTTWEVFPNALSAALQYASLDWPVEDGWVNYNSLQQLAYFTVVFIAAPLAIITGVRMSGAWPKTAPRLNRVYPILLARIIHYPVMLFFVLFVIVHVTLVLATDARRNLNHMYAARSDDSWLGFWIFAAAIVVMIVAWLAARPLFLRPVATLTGKLSR